MIKVSSTSRFQSIHTATFVELIQQTGLTLLISTYQAGKVVVLRAENGVINADLHDFDSPMGIAYDGRGRLAVGTKEQVWEFGNQAEVEPQIEPPQTRDGCFVQRQVQTTGQIGIHDIAWAGEELWVVNTRFSCLCTLDPRYSFVPRWRPMFVSALVPEDRCHLNGLAMREEKPRYVTAHGQTNTLAGWRDNKARGGCLIDVVTGQVIAGGLSMPHSPRWHDGRLWLLESGAGSLARVDLTTGRLETVALLPGFTRGLDFHGPFAFIGLSQVRQSASFSGLPITDRLPVEQRACGVWVVDTRTGQIVGFMRFQSGVQEIFAVQVVPGMRWLEVLPDSHSAVAEAFLLPDELVR